ncbi:MBL fold metallo-hydrolase [Microbaculum marinum]|uniref:MBL fold metallo-hydrolase n=1 Tax=Microbaculum marinum TaxID=1764581 RepID=A0AAW9RK45_9HYPH
MRLVRPFVCVALRPTVGIVLAGLLAALPAAPASAQDVEPERCPRLIAYDPPRVVPAAFRLVQAEAGSDVRLTYVGHSTFLIESPAGVTIATDYNDMVRPTVVPRIATMNIAHSSHHSYNPDPGIEHLLPGWKRDGEPAKWELTVDDVWLRNVTTNIRGGFAETERDANSMFVFEVAGLCILHLGHLHHVLTGDHLKALGRIDVVLAPVDGSYTLDVEGMIETLQDLQAPLIIPMHYFGSSTLNRFLVRMGAQYEVVLSDTPSVVVSRDSLPVLPTVLVLPGY